MVQFCLQGQADLADLTSELRSIAQQEHMQFIDASARTRQDLQTINAPQSVRVDPVINMGVERDDGVGLGLGNMGLPSYQVAMGFSEGSNPPEAHAFAARVLQKLSAQWHLKTVPAGTGALPMKSCD